MSTTLRRCLGLYDIIIQDPSFLLSVPTYAASNVGTLSCSTLNFAFAISEMNSTVSTESTHKVQYDQIPRRDPRRKQLILKTKLDHPSMENWEIAARADCSTDYVGRVLRTNPIIGLLVNRFKLQIVHHLPPPALKQQRKIRHGSKRLLRPILLV